MSKPVYEYYGKLLFKKEYATQENVWKLSDILYNALEEVSGDKQFSELDGQEMGISLEGAGFAGYKFEETLVKEGYVPKLAECQWRCVGDDGTFFYRIKNGEFEECNSLVIPDEDWSANYAWLEAKGKEEQNV